MDTVNTGILNTLVLGFATLMFFLPKEMLVVWELFNSIAKFVSTISKFSYSFESRTFIPLHIFCEQNMWMIFFSIDICTGAVTHRSTQIQGKQVYSCAKRSVHCLLLPSQYLLHMWLNILFFKPFFPPEYRNKIWWHQFYIFKNSLQGATMFLQSEQITVFSDTFSIHFCCREMFVTLQMVTWVVQRLDDLSIFRQKVCDKAVME